MSRIGSAKFTFDRQEELSIFAANKVFGDRYPEQGIEFKSGQIETVDKFCSDVIFCKTQSREFLATAVLKVNLMKMASLFPTFAETPYTKHIDTFFECVNQYLGVINHNFLRLMKLEFRVGLPTYYHMTSFKIGAESQAFEGVSISDKHDIFYMDLGYLSIQGEDNFGKIDFKDTAFEVSAAEEDDFEFF